MKIFFNVFALFSNIDIEGEGVENLTPLISGLTDGRTNGPTDETDKTIKRMILL